VAVLPIDWPRFLARFPAGGAPALFSLLGAASPEEARESRAPATPARMRHRLEEAPAAERRELLLAHVREQVIRVLGLDPSRPPSSRQGLTDIGMDSLMAVELRNRLEASLGCSLPSTLAFEHPNIEALTAFLAERVVPAAPPPGPPPAADRRDQGAAAVEKLSPEELEASLLNELDRAGY
jgi:acyl carrier protein